ncbi:MAG TPA: peptidase S10 [Methylomirabilota bacterium]|nr:peptidase S10 [Methylomirabilota bacterium]
MFTATWFVCLGLVSALSLSVARAADEPARKDEKAAEGSKEAKAKGKDDEKPVETKHKVMIGGREIPYTARAGTIQLRDAEDKPTASIFYIAYTRDDDTNAATRPLTFSFNGGPGSSSVWLHLGLLGPRRVVLEEDGRPLPPPYRLTDNEYSLLDETDLVFIDPVSTGYSRAAKPAEASKFHGVREDVASVGEFIRLYVTRHLRWASPKFIIGESYGTTRAAALSGELAGRHRMNVNGIMLVSTVLNFQTIRFDQGNDLPYVLFLPSYTATAWYHKKLPADLQALKLEEVLAQAEAFAAGPYNTALLKGSALTPEERKTLVRETARFTGLSETYVERSNLRVPLHRFARELLADENRVVGRFDSRYTGAIRDRVNDSMEYDPSGEAIFSVFASTFNDYVRRELKYESDLAYEILAGLGWNWGGNNQYLNVAETLADSLTRNPFLQVHVSEGYYDLATPYFASRYTFHHLGLDPALMTNITMDAYTAGHMMYVNLPDLKKQKADLAKFLRGATGR